MNNCQVKSRRRFAPNRSPSKTTGTTQHFSLRALYSEAYPAVVGCVSISFAKSYIQKQLKERTSDLRMSGKNVAMRNAVITLSIVCVIALISIPVIFVYHNSIFQLKDQEITRLNGLINQNPQPSSNPQIADLQNQIADLQNQKANLESTIAELRSQIAAAGTHSQVQVSGTVRDYQTGTIYFRTSNESVRTSSPIIDGKYNALLIGGESYDIYIDYYHSTNYYTPDFTLYVPLGVTVFTANF